MPVKLVRYTYKQTGQDWNKKDTLTPYQNLMYDAYKENVVNIQEGYTREDPTEYDGNVQKKTFYFDTANNALAFWTAINDTTNPYVKAYRDSIANTNPLANNFVQHKIETTIEQLDGTVIVEVQPRQS